MFCFRDIIGQDNAKQHLLAEAREGRIPHALLFCGPQGAGKLPLALAYARYLCCKHPAEDEACGNCPSCHKWDKLVHPDVHFMFPIVKNTKTKKEICDDYLPAWRKLLTDNWPGYFGMNRWLDMMDAPNGQPIIYARESDEITRKLSFRPSGNGYRFILIWLPEKMHEACANKLLKLLEEPPEHTIFLLVSEEPERILPTIVSRTQRFSMGPVATDDMAEALQRLYGLQPDESRTIAHQSEGNVIKALDSLKTDEDNRLYFDLFVSLMRLAYQRKIRELKTWSEELSGMGREKQKAFLDYSQRMTRENFIYNLHQPQMNYMTLKESEFASRFAPFVNVRNVRGIMDELSEAQVHIEQNVNARMVFFDFALQMIMLLKT